jgi:hypothetical protein
MGMTIQTDEGCRYNLPRAIDEAPNVAPGTPLAVIGLFLLALRCRFGKNSIGENWVGGGSIGMEEDENYVENNTEPLPWYWDENLQPADECILDVDNRVKVLIEAAFNVEKSVKNYRPAIYVNRGPVVPQKIVVDNRAGEHLPSGSKAYFSLARMPLSIECIAENSGESAILADTVWFFILSTRNIYRETFGLYDITEPILGETQEDTEDKEVWKTVVTFDVFVELRWGVRPISPLLNEIALKIHAAGDPNLFYHQIVLRESVR